MYVLKCHTCQKEIRGDDTIFTFDGKQFCSLVCTSKHEKIYSEWAQVAQEGKDNESHSLSQ